MSAGTFSYDTRLATSKDEVRLRINDTDPDSFEFSDNEINAVLNRVSGDVLQACIVLSKSLLFKYTRQATSKKAGPYSEDTTRRADAYRLLVEQLMDEADEPWDEVAEFDHGDPMDPYRDPNAQAYLNREDLRGQI